MAVFMRVCAGSFLLQHIEPNHQRGSFSRNADVLRTIGLCDKGMQAAEQTK